MASALATPACSLLANLGQFDGAQASGDDATGQLAADAASESTPSDTQGSGGDTGADGSTASQSPDSQAGGDATYYYPDGAPNLSAFAFIERGPWCAAVNPAPFFCRDFDSTLPPEKNWDSSNGCTGTFGAETLRSTSAPRSLTVSTDPVSVTATAACPLFYHYPALPPRVQLGYDLFISSLPSGEATLQRVQLGTAPSDWYLGLLIRDGAAFIEVVDHKNPPGDFPLAKVPGVGGWSRIVIDLELPVAQAAALSVTFDGLRAMSTPVHPDVTKLNTLSIEMGLDSAPGPSNAIAFSIDNVALYVQ